MGFAMRSIVAIFLLLLPAGLQGCAGKTGDPLPAVESEQHAQPAEPVYMETMTICWGKEECKK